MLFFSIASCKTESKPKVSDEVQAEKIIEKINKSQNIEYVAKKISGNLDFTKSTSRYSQSAQIGVIDINSALTFINCTFTDSIIGFSTEDKFAYLSNFNKTVTFINCTFEKPVLLRQNRFKDIVEFTNCHFDENTHFEGSTFSGDNTYFKENIFNKNARFTNTNYYGNVIFMNNGFASNAYFNNCFFNRNSNFSSSSFSSTVTFENSEFRGFWRLNYSVFSKKAYINNCKLDGKLDAVKIISKENFIFSENKCNDKIIFEQSTFRGRFEFANNNLFEEKNIFEDAKKSEDCQTIIKSNYYTKIKTLKLAIKNTENKD